MRAGRLVFLGLTLVGPVGAPAIAAQARVGFYGGLASSRLGGGDVVGWESRSGPLGGGFVNLPLSRVFALRPGLAWVSKGAQDEVQSLRVALAIQYFQITVLGQFTLPTAALVEPYAVIGPAVGLKFRCDFSVRDEVGREASADCDSPLFQGAFPIRANDMGVLVGAGVSIGPRRRLSGLLELSYELGLMSVDAGTPTYDVKNRSLAIKAGVMFSLAQ
jgi:hypothetical protein